MRELRARWRLAQASATARTAASPFAKVSQRRPLSAETKTHPSSVPITTVSPCAATQLVSTLSENHSGSPSTQRPKVPASRVPTIERGTAPVMARGRAQDHRVTPERNSPAIVRVQALVLPRPCVPAVAAHSKAVEGGHEHKMLISGRRVHLVHVVLDVEQ